LLRLGNNPVKIDGKDIFNIISKWLKNYIKIILILLMDSKLLLKKIHSF
jgi:hypothetical protein